MEKHLIAIASGLVEDKSAVKVDRDEPNDEGVVVYHLHVAPDDMGRVIGKQGKIAKAIRTVMRAGAGRINEKIMVEIDLHLLYGNVFIIGITNIVLPIFL